MLLLNLCNVKFPIGFIFLYDVLYSSLLVEDQNVQRKMLLKECEEVYQKVVQDQTSVNIYIARLNFLGLPRSGKSTTMKRLVGEIVDIATAKWTKELESTGVAERHQALICRKISQHFTFGWSKSDLSKETALLNYFMKQAVKGKFSMIITIV